MHFLEECRRSEDDRKAGQAKTAARVKAKAAQISTTSNRYLGGASEKFSFTC